MSEPTAPPEIVFFDGVCNFCNASIDFLIRRDPERRLRYSSLQSPFARRFFEAQGREDQLEALDRMYFWDGQRLHSRSGAALRICRTLRAPWPILSGLLVVPPFLRDAVYDLVSRNRYRVWGRRDACRVPSPEERELFLEE